jgi:hypothetical protein
LTAVLGIAAVAWYSRGRRISEEEIEHEIKAGIEAKEKARARRAKFFSFRFKKSQVP